MLKDTQEAIRAAGVREVSWENGERLCSEGEDGKPGSAGWSAEDRGPSAADSPTVVQALGRCSVESPGWEWWIPVDGVSGPQATSVP